MANEYTSNHYIVSEEYDGERLDKLLALFIPGKSRSYLQGLFAASAQNKHKSGKKAGPNVHEERNAAEYGGGVLLNGKICKPSTRVQEGDEIDVRIPDKIIPDIVPENIPLDILYEDDDVLVVNKPKEMVVHPAPGHYSGTLVNAVMYHCGSSLSGINGVLRPGIVHRIDKDTTGSVIICKNDAAHQSIASQLAAHTIVRRYAAICLGDLKEDEITITGNIGRDHDNRKRMAIVPDGEGKPAITHVHVLERFRGYTYVECRLETGRTHQIRVHMASIGHPLLGDELYGGTDGRVKMHLVGQCLHARILGFVHPTTGEYVETDAGLPEYFERLLHML